MRQLFLLLILAFLFSGCSLKSYLEKSISESEAFEHSFTGLVIYDPDIKEEIFNLNGSKYFTPASNTKLFTFYAGLKVLKDSVPALYYTNENDSLIIWGTGDPSFLHPELPQGNVIEFIRSSEIPVFLSSGNYYDNALGPGWAWDDAKYKFSSEKSYFPVYGNYFRILKDSVGWSAQPEIFSKFLQFEEKSNSNKIEITQLTENNQVSIIDSDENLYFEKEIPIKFTPEILKEILEDTLKRKITLIKKPITNYKILYSIPVDSVYKTMLQESDNFIAEQLLMLYAGMLTDSLSTEIGINSLTEMYLKDFPDKFIWKDGSGLSRYNLFTPLSLVYLLEKIYLGIPIERLLGLLPAGGVSGTIKEWYISDEPYLFAKTGTMSNNHNLSGYLKTKNNRVLIFSFMHNHYQGSSFKIKAEMQKILWEIHEKY